MACPPCPFPLRLALLLLLIAPLAPAQAEFDVRVLPAGAPLLESPDSGAPLVAKLPGDTRLRVGRESGAWYRVRTRPGAGERELSGWVEKRLTEPLRARVKDKVFLMGLGMVRLNWTGVRGDAIRFRYSDLGLPADFSTRERASFMVDGTLGDGRWDIGGHLDYDPENRISEPPLHFLFTASSARTSLSLGDYQTGVLLDSVFARYFHPFRGGVLRTGSPRLGIELLTGMARGESGVDELPADLGAGPYFLDETPLLRGSELVWLVSRSLATGAELRRTLLRRNLDYFVDYDRGTLLFTSPLYPHDELGNPVFLLVTYQFESLGGRFTRGVYGLRAFAAPLPELKLTATWIGDTATDRPLAELLDTSRNIYSAGLEWRSRPLDLSAELACSAEPGAGRHWAGFASAVARPLPHLVVRGNGWSIGSEFPTFANTQLQYGYSLQQIYPAYAARSLFLSPFQFSRNLGAELYPFTLSRLEVSEKEADLFAEWERGRDRVSAGVGLRRQAEADRDGRTLYLSALHDAPGNQIWAKAGLTREYDGDRLALDNRLGDLLLGTRQRLKQLKRGALFVQADLQAEWNSDLLDVGPDSRRRVVSLLAEYLSGQHGVFAGYRHETASWSGRDEPYLRGDIVEFGVRHPVWRGFFLDCRYRHETGTRETVAVDNDILSLGGGIESQDFRALARWELQHNRGGDSRGQRQLWSLYLYGSPLKRMSLSAQYYRQSGRDEVPLSLSERSEEQLGLRLLWRPWDSLQLYSQWRHDGNLERLPELAGSRSRSLASVQGLKWRWSKRLEWLANYKRLQVWGPIESRRFTFASELGYLLLRHLRLAAGVERGDYRDPLRPDAGYRSTVGYFKLVALY